jgi:hypothetical protein
MVGLTFDHIAEQTGYSDRSGAKRAYDCALERWAVETVEQQRIVQTERLDDLWRRVFREIARGDLDQVDRALRIEKRRAELWGLDAPKQHEVTGVAGGVLRTDVGDLARLQQLREEQGPLVVASTSSNGQPPTGMDTPE